MWMYTDIYKSIVRFIDSDLRNTDYILNFGVVAIATQSPRTSVKFCLRNIQTNKQKRWTFLLYGETLKVRNKCKECCKCASRSILKELM